LSVAKTSTFSLKEKQEERGTAKHYQQVIIKGLIRKEATISI